MISLTTIMIITMIMIMIINDHKIVIITMIMIITMIKMKPIMSVVGSILPLELPTALSFPALRLFGPDQTLET